MAWVFNPWLPYPGASAQRITKEAQRYPTSPRRGGCIPPTFFLLTYLLASTTLCSRASAQEKNSSPREFSLDLWDWTHPCQDLPTFDAWARDLKSLGLTRLEISAPWRLLEPQPHQYDLSFIADRLAIAKKHGLALRLRINSYYNGATPAWYQGDFWQDINGQAPQGTPNPPSITDERFWSHYAPLCTAIAQRFKGEDLYYNAFIGVHAELKFADWWSYDPATLALWKRTTADRPDWLKDIAGDAPLPDKPPIPAPTHGTPDNSPASKSWIAFREHLWRTAVHRFTTAIRAGDPAARISAPLGESFRRQSAAFSNLDYYGLSRGANQVVHSYDFYWHPKDPAWQAAAAVASFRGITHLPVSFEFDGPALTDQLGYSLDHLTDIARAATNAGAGLKAANYSYSTQLPSTFPILKTFAQLTSESTPAPPSTSQSTAPTLETARQSPHAEAERRGTPQSAASGTPPPNQTILLFVSKWANYCYREPTEWLHEAQFGAWKMLTDHNLPVRFICEDNLAEPDLPTYRGLYVAFSPPELLPPRDRARLTALQSQLPTVVEIAHAPTTPPALPSKDSLPTHVSSITAGQRAVMNYPLAYHYLHHSNHPAQQLMFNQNVLPLFKPAP